MSEETAQQKPKSSGSGCLKAAGIGCLVVVVVAVAGAFLVYKNMGRLAAKVMVVGTEAMFDGLKMPPDEKAAAMVPIRELADKIRNGEVTAQQGVKILEGLGKSALPTVIMLKAFDLKYLEVSGLAAEDKQAARVTISRFTQGLVDTSIPSAKGEEVANVLTVKTQGSGGKETSQLKETISEEELTRCLQIMKEAADTAGIEEKTFSIDLAAEIRKAIQKGMDEDKLAPPQP